MASPVSWGVPRGGYFVVNRSTWRFAIDKQGEIFRQFVRGRDARTRGIKGTGIGLAMVQHIVHGHGGRLALESVPGEGSTFTIVLPASQG